MDVIDKYTTVVGRRLEAVEVSTVSHILDQIKGAGGDHQRDD
jgi:hypothetical protein